MTDRAAEPGRLAGFTVAITAARRAEEFGAALERQGATVQYAPAVRIVPLADDTHLRRTSEQVLSRGVDIVVATTGIGFRGWMEAADTWDLAEKLQATLSRAELIARGPKVTGAIRAAKLTEKWAPESESTIEVLEHLLSRQLHGTRIAVQLHGEPLGWFLDALRAAGAEVIDVPVYRSELPDDITPLTRLIHLIANQSVDCVDCVAFTSAAASTNFLQLVPTSDESAIGDAMTQRVLAACVGPVTAAPLTSVGIPVTYPDRFRLGALVKQIAEQLPQHRTRTVKLSGRTLEIRGHAVVLDDSLIQIGGTGIAFLRKLAEQPGRVVPRAELLRSLPRGSTDGHAVEAAISRLRTQLDDPKLIETVVKRGYRLAS